MKKIIILFLGLFINYSSYSQSFEINIDKLNSDILSFSHLKYSITENGIKIKNGVSDKIIYKKCKISNTAKEELYGFFANNDIFKMDTIYRQRPIVMGGPALALELTIKKSTRIIYFTCYQPILDDLIKILNKSLPKKYAILRFTVPCRCSYPSNPCELLKSD
jgi:hypothetical protein